jgi:death-on-curing protein
MRHLTPGEVLELHRRMLGETGRRRRDSRPRRAGFGGPSAQSQLGGSDLYPTPVEKAAALCFSLVENHPFVDGSKRAGHAAMETFLVVNGFESQASVDEQKRLMLDLAAGRLEGGFN